MQYDFQVNAGGGQQIDVVGYFIKYKSGIGAIRVKTNVGGYVDLLPGQGVRLEKQFSSLTVVDRTGLGNQGVLLAGAFEFQDDSIVGTVSVVDGGKNSTLSANCFLGTVNAGTAATYYNGAGLANPAGNTKNVVVESIIVSVPAAAVITVHIGGIVIGQVGSAANKLPGGAVSSAKLQTNPALAVSMFGIQAAKLYMAANSSVTLKLAEPLILAPGGSVQIVNNAVAADVAATFEFREDPI